MESVAASCTGELGAPLTPPSIRPGARDSTTARRAGDVDNKLYLAVATKPRKECISQRPSLWPLDWRGPELRQDWNVHALVADPLRGRPLWRGNVRNWRTDAEGELASDNNNDSLALQSSSSLMRPCLCNTTTVTFPFCSMFVSAHSIFAAAPLAPEVELVGFIIQTGVCRERAQYRVQSLSGAIVWPRQSC